MEKEKENKSFLDRILNIDSQYLMYGAAALLGVGFIVYMTSSRSVEPSKSAVKSLTQSPYFVLYLVIALLLILVTIGTAVWYFRKAPKDDKYSYNNLVSWTRSHAKGVTNAGLVLLALSIVYGIAAWYYGLKPFTSTIAPAPAPAPGR